MARTKRPNYINNNAVEEVIELKQNTNNKSTTDQQMDDNNVDTEDPKNESIKNTNNDSKNESINKSNNESMNGSKTEPKSSSKICLKQKSKLSPKFDLKPEANIYFVEVKAVGSAVRQPESMNNAFASMKCFKFTPEWLKEDELFEKEWSDPQKYLFIIDSFNGRVFDFLLDKKLRIISPLTVLYCYSPECTKRYRNIPEKSFPVFSQCMRKLFVSISGFDGHKKQEMITRIERMCGNYCKDFTKKVTHLVTDTVRSQKYKVAKKFGINVLSSQWIDHCWNDCQHNLLNAADSEIVNKFRIKMFTNLLITVSQVDVEERNKIKELVEQNGGEYSPSLKLSYSNTVLLLRKPEGTKFKYAFLRGVPCLDVKWLYDSLEKGYALPEEEYAIRSSSQLSDKTQKLLAENKTNPISDKQIDKTAENTGKQSEDKTQEDNSTSKATQDSQRGPKDNNTSQYIMETITQSTCDRTVEPFLEGCDTYLIGFDRPVFECIKSALISRGSMVYTEYKSIVTHVIVGPDCNDSELQQFFEKKSSKVVTFDWILECIRVNECCDCTRFEIKNPFATDESLSQKRKREAANLFDGPLTVVCPKRARKAVERWESQSKTDSNRNHKSLGDRLNKKTDIQWGNDEEDHVLSQRPYKEGSDEI